MYILYQKPIQKHLARTKLTLLSPYDSANVKRAAILSLNCSSHSKNQKKVRTVLKCTTICLILSLWACHFLALVLNEKSHRLTISLGLLLVFTSLPVIDIIHFQPLVSSQFRCIFNAGVQLENRFSWGRLN